MLDKGRFSLLTRHHTTKFRQCVLPQQLEPPRLTVIGGAACQRRHHVHEHGAQSYRKTPSNHQMIPLGQHRQTAPVAAKTKDGNQGLADACETTRVAPAPDPASDQSTLEDHAVYSHPHRLQWRGHKKQCISPIWQAEVSSRPGQRSRSCAAYFHPHNMQW